MTPREFGPGFESEKPRREPLRLPDEFSTLPQEHQQIVRAYVRTHERNEHNEQGLGFLMDFLRYPDQFEPTDQAMTTAYRELVLQRLDPQAAPWWERVRYSAIDPDRMRNVQVHLRYGNASTTGRSEICLDSTAEVRLSNNEPWRTEKTNGSIAFLLDDWVKRKTEPHREGDKFYENPPIG